MRRLPVSHIATNDCFVLLSPEDFKLVFVGHFTICATLVRIYKTSVGLLCTPKWGEVMNVNGYLKSNNTILTILPGGYLNYLRMQMQ